MLLINEVFKTTFVNFFTSLPEFCLDDLQNSEAFKDHENTLEEAKVKYIPLFESNEVYKMQRILL